MSDLWFISVYVHILAVGEITAYTSLTYKTGWCVARGTTDRNQVRGTNEAEFEAELIYRSLSLGPGRPPPISHRVGGIMLHGYQ